MTVTAVDNNEVVDKKKAYRITKNITRVTTCIEAWPEEKINPQNLFLNRLTK
jgi:hypothetical protein